MGWNRRPISGGVLGGGIARRVLVAGAAFVLGALPTDSQAQQRCPTPPVALFETATNSVQLIAASTRVPVPASRQLQVCSGDTIRVGDNSRAVILILASNTPFAIDQNTELTLGRPDDRVICQPGDPARSVINLLRGALLYLFQGATTARDLLTLCQRVD